MINLEDIKNYLKVDFNEDDTLLQTLIESASSMVIEGTKPDVDTNDKRFELAVMMLVAHWYENRGIVPSYGASMPFGVAQLLTQLGV